MYQILGHISFFHTSVVHTSSYDVPWFNMHFQAYSNAFENVKPPDGVMVTETPVERGGKFSWLGKWIEEERK